MVKRCVVCGREFDEEQMIKRFTGKTFYTCWECYKLGQEKYQEMSIDVGVKIARKNGR